jgi:carboxymethylenebutenolidase
MCFDPTARPPIDGDLQSVESRAFRLESSPRCDMAAFRALPTLNLSRTTGVLLLLDNRGVTPFYERLAKCLASEGYPTLAIDYFARQESDPKPDLSDMRAVMQRIADLTRDGCYDNVNTGVQHLRNLDSVKVERVIALGFCMGGRIAFLTSQAHFGLAGVIGLYGSTGAILDAPGPTQLAAQFTAPILGIFGGADVYIPAQSVSLFEKALADAGVSHEIVVYPGAPHSFFDVAYQEHAAICADTWRRILGFLEAHSG